MSALARGSTRPPYLIFLRAGALRPTRALTMVAAVHERRQTNYSGERRGAEGSKPGLYFLKGRRLATRFSAPARVAAERVREEHLAGPQIDREHEGGRCL
jgi:hypothetical protein